MPSLYIHVPFCRSFCGYCSFYSEIAGAGDPRLGRYVDRALLDAEAILREFRPERVPTVYLGGGTPSALGAGNIRRLLAGLRGLLAGLPPPVEITVEANPESADEAFMDAVLDGAGEAARLSLGVQTLRGASRKALGRAGDAGGVLRALALASERFRGRFSADLLAGVPLQTGDSLASDIDTVLAYGGGHVSLYALTLEEGTPLGDMGGRGLPQGDEADGLWLRGRDALEAAGYRQYEVSNFALPGLESRHNLAYWRMEGWLAAGPGASSTVIPPGLAREGEGAALRYTVNPALDPWLARRGDEAPRVTEERLGRLTLLKESIMMGFRTIWGPPEGLFRERFGLGVGEAIPRTLRSWRKRGLLSQTPSPALNREGLLFLDRFVKEAWEEISEGD